MNLIGSFISCSSVLQLYIHWWVEILKKQSSVCLCLFVRSCRINCLYTFKKVPPKSIHKLATFFHPFILSFLIYYFLLIHRAN